MCMAPSWDILLSVSCTYMWNGSFHSQSLRTSHFPMLSDMGPGMRLTALWLSSATHITSPVISDLGNLVQKKITTTGHHAMTSPKCILMPQVMQWVTHSWSQALHWLSWSSVTLYGWSGAWLIIEKERETQDYYKGYNWQSGGNVAMMLCNNGELEERKVFSLQNCMQKSFARVNTHSFLGESKYR